MDNSAKRIATYPDGLVGQAAALTRPRSVQREALRQPTYSNSMRIRRVATDGATREQEQKRTMLFPIRLDDAVMEIKTGWPAHIKNTRHIGDFTCWKDHDAYLKSFARLLRDLKASELKKR